MANVPGLGSVLTSLIQLRRARIKADRVLEEFDAAVDELRDRWRLELHGDADFDIWMFGEPHEAEAQEGQLADDDAEEFARIRDMADALRTDVHRGYTAIIEPALAEFRRQLQVWINVTPTDDATRQWGVVLSNWRNAVGATARHAGETLGVNASSVVRYEKGVDNPGGRVPSGAQLQKLVRELAEAPVPLGPMNNDDRVTRAMTRLFGLDRSDYADVLEAKLVDSTSVIDGVRYAVDGLSGRQLRILAAIVEHPTGLADLLTYVERSFESPAEAVRDRVLEGLAADQHHHGLLAVSDEGGAQ